MKKSGRGKRLFLFILTAAMIFTMQDFSVLAEQVPLENGTGSQPEAAPESSGSQPEQSEGGTGTSAEESVEPPQQPESQPEQSTEQPDGGDGTPDGAQGETPETLEEQSPEVEGETQGKSPETSSEQPPVPEADNPEILTAAPENNFTTEVDADLDGAAGMSLGLDAGTLAAHTVPSQNPGQAVVNLFDYWQYPGDTNRYGNEVSHDYWKNDSAQTDAVTTYDIGISKEHLLRFGYREIEMNGAQAKCLYCHVKGDYGKWNEYSPNGPREGIVKNILGADGFPHLNLVNESDYGAYDEPNNRDVYLADKTKNESLDYLFSPNVDVVDSNGGSFKASYTNVQGLFQMDNDGYYYYDSTKNFAELDAGNPGNPHFILYDSPGAADSKGNYGQFFPFNGAEDVFDNEYTASDGKNYLSYVDAANNENSNADYIPVKNAEGVGFIPCYAPGLNHYLGMTLEVPFLQPVGGQLPNKEAMSFKFSGDDDVWIFIDGVLVADLGGLHDACSLKIDFATGAVYVQDMNTPDHTLLESFRDAYPGNASSWNPGGVAFAPNTDTFADNTVHTLKMFYLERGNIASNLSLSFNLQTARYNQIKKVDQNGNAIENVEFALYPATICNAEDEGSILCNSTVGGERCYVRQTDVTPLLTLKTDPAGVADFSNYTFSAATKYYILHETAPPAGYRSQPVDIVLEYNSQTTMLSVANRWETGAYASFTSYVSEQAGVQLIYGQYNVSTGLVEKGTENVPDDSREKGLILAVPMLQRGNSTVWLPLYGSNLDGFHTTGVESADEGSMKRALLTAALNQCLYNEGWYLEWNPAKNILEGNLSDLPGRADRYRHENTNGDMQMAYIIIKPAALIQITNNAGNSTERYAALKQYVAANGVNAAVNTIYDGNAGADVRLLDTAQFIRVFRSLIYISNEQRELRVMKVDENGQPLNGAQFGLYASIDDAQQNRNAVAVGVTANVEGMEGLLIFKPQANGEPGYAQMVWADALEQQYYLKEISAPKGYTVNKTIVPVVVGIYSIYADAGSAGDGVSVMAGAGQLYRTMAKYASDGDVNITLRDITVTAQRQDSGQFVLDGWQDMNESGQKQEKNLHYGVNGEMGMDYGLHDEDLGSTPFFRTDTGFLRVRVSQNTRALQDELYNGAINIANWDDLGGTDLTGLFSLLNVVVVEDRPGQDSDDDYDSDDNGDDSEMTDTGTEPDTEVKTSPTGLDVIVERIGTPQTGDDSLMWWWALLGIISLVGIGATVCNLIIVKKKQKRYSPKEAKKKCLPKKIEKKYVTKEKKKKHLSKRKQKKYSVKK
ncbi:MAG: hypothetical protein HFI50_14020 [Lachnospiraceae bacterium]|nr:hypothetical protein [Lachnospiraceae bacterium]